nr:MAG TPA: hypothetical protein [Microviridae sp.]
MKWAFLNLNTKSCKYILLMFHLRYIPSYPTTAPLPDVRRGRNNPFSPLGEQQERSGCSPRKHQRRRQCSNLIDEVINQFSQRAIC